MNMNTPRISQENVAQRQLHFSSLPAGLRIIRQPGTFPFLLDGRHQFD